MERLKGPVGKNYIVKALSLIDGDDWDKATNAIRDLTGKLSKFDPAFVFIKNLVPSLEWADVPPYCKDERWRKLRTRKNPLQNTQS